MERKQFTFYRSYFEAIKDLPQKDMVAAIKYICEISLNGIADTSSLSSRAELAILSIKKEIETEIRSSLEGRRCAEYKNWRKSVFERDNYTCKTCGRRGVKLNAHHIKPYALCHDARFDIDNGITLCESCHRAVHKGR